MDHMHAPGAYQLVLTTSDVRNFHVVGGWRQIFQLLAREDVESDQVDFGVTMLARLGSRHFDDLAGTTLDDDEPVLPQGRALHRVSG